MALGSDGKQFSIQYQGKDYGKYQGLTVPTQTMLKWLSLGLPQSLGLGQYTVELSFSQDLVLEERDGKLFAKMDLIQGEDQTSMTSYLGPVEREDLQNIKLVSYNVEHFRSVTNPKNAISDYRFGESNWNQMIDLKREKIARALVLSGLPEVVAIQEVEDAASFESLKEELKGLGYQYFSVGDQGNYKVKADGSVFKDLSDDAKPSMTTAIASMLPITAQGTVPLYV